MWHFRGGTDDGPIKHTGLVLLDSEGNHMYGQIPTGTVDRLKDVLEEGKVYVIKKFLCNMSRPSFRPVESPFMVQFTWYTVVEARPGLEDTFPFCTYNLTAFGDIPRPTVIHARFIDVIGTITMVSDVTPVQSMYQTSPSNTRTIMLADLSGNELRLSCCSFACNIPTSIRGLSGSSVCRWYVDEDIADINSFRSSLGKNFTPLASYVPTGPDALLPRVQEDPVDKVVKELAELDPFVDMDKRFLCTVEVTRIGDEQRWWFPSCGGYRKYGVSVFASDGTSKAEFVLFDKISGIEETYKPKLPTSTADVASGSGGLVSPGGISGSKLKALGPIMSPVTRTPPSVGPKDGLCIPATPTTRVPTSHKRGTRRTLFGRSPKEISPSVGETVSLPAQATVLAATSDGEVATASKRKEIVPPKENEEVATEPDDNDTLPLKIKRTPPGGKGDGLKKKAKS